MEIISNHLVYLIPIAVGVLAQATKFGLFTLRNGWRPEYIFTHGHMPSAHTAFAISLLTSIGYFEGMSSAAFAVTVGLAFLIIDDAFRIRVILGDQGRYLNMLVKQLEMDSRNFPRLKERVGHKANEVIVGALFGFFLTWTLISLLA